MRVRLEVTRGPAAGTIFPFEEPDIFMFGRSTDVSCSIISDPGISATHFMIQMNPPDCSLMDLGSTNGTTVNRTHYGGKKRNVRPGCEWKRQPVLVPLRDGDTIIAGASHFRVGITYDLVCAGCGVKFVVHGNAELTEMKGVPVCSECSRQEAEKASAAAARGRGERAAPAKKQPYIVRPAAPQVLCSRCGRDVTTEAGIRAVGDHVGYVCTKCRESTISFEDVREALRAQRQSGELEPGLDFGKDAPPPPPIEGYEHLRLLGVGGMGAVYLSRRTGDSELFAVKTLLPEVAVKPQAAARFERETDVAAALKHPNIIRVHERGNVGAVFYFVMEYVDGTDIDDLVIDRGGCLPLDESIDIVLKALDGLAYAHEQHYVHRDIKPANILLGGHAAPWTVKVTDFGLAKSFEQAGLSGLTTGNAPCGSLNFMPREQIIRYRWVKPTADVYSMAATLYYMLTGRPVRKGLEGEKLDMPAAVRAITNEPVVPVRKRDRSIPQELAAVIDRSLRGEESKRYRNAGAMRRALLRAVGR
jgi:serine/threonine-protein kinase